MPMLDLDRLADAARRAGNAYTDLITSLRYHRGRIDTAFDRDEARAKYRRRRKQTWAAEAPFLDAIQELVRAGGADEARAILAEVGARALKGIEPDPEAVPC